ncbi:CerR family C-terminal domain-containing protein [Thermodesulfatator autotrophicus]|uniref:HTH tetR-type domain-containing protein n=1 Tax=Thermodesulfatator autotrophicus TaxID=1795632 RepID=A0A177E7U1_9BACT|nr:CerR family C-terminal domain-containing protein [Thermodesulfatator autotrophicus]OAG28014.1 hypothetical protein TH606_04040 [Thermodesulfatator autotrophicus]
MDNGAAVNVKERLVLIAEKLFAEKGFNSVSVREITSKAGVNLGAINYHFGSKKGLYLEVFRARFLDRARRLRGAFEKNLKKEKDSLEGVIRSLARAILCGPLTDEERTIHFKLLVREMAHPTEAFDLITEEALKPLLSSFEKALKEYLPALSEEKMRLVMLSVLAQILYFNFARPKIQAATGKTFDEEFKKALVEHIVAFSLKGIEGLS